MTRCAPQYTPLTVLPLRHNRLLPIPSGLLPPLTSPSKTLGTLAKLTSATETTWRNFVRSLWNRDPEHRRGAAIRPATESPGEQCSAEDCGRSEQITVSPN